MFKKNTKHPLYDLEKIPEELGLFCHNQAFLIPGIELSLNIYDLSYIDLVIDAIELNYRYFGVVTPIPKKLPRAIGCVAKITSFTEVNEQKFHITIKGVNRFRIERKHRSKRPYNIITADYSEFIEDSQFANFKLENREYINQLVFDYVDIVEKNMLEIEKIRNIPDLKLFSFLCNNVELSKEKRLQLIQSQDFSEIQFIIEKATEVSIANSESKDFVKH